jgi:hypothetical protein
MDTTHLDDAWQGLCDKDDRTSPAEYPEMVLVSYDELAAILKPLQDEVTFWRQDAAARLWAGMALAKAAEKKGEEARAAEIRVSILMPTRAALASALSGDIYHPCCEGCGVPIVPGDAVWTYEGGEVTHVSCEKPKLRDLQPSPPDATRWAEDQEFTPEGIAKRLAEVTAYLDGSDA